MDALITLGVVYIYTGKKRNNRGQAGGDDRTDGLTIGHTSYEARRKTRRKPARAKNTLYMNRCVTQLTPVSWYSNAVSRVVGLRFRALGAYCCLDLLAPQYVFRARQDWEPAEIGDQANSSESGAPEGLILIALRLKSLHTGT